MSQGCVVFSHGQDGEPWGVKITALAETARCEGYAVESVDYRGVDSVQTRTAMLIDACKAVRGELVLVGSSLGGYVSLAAAAALHAYGVFLLAPAIFMEGLPPLRKSGFDCPVTIVHGLRDDVVPHQHSVRFAADHGATLHLVNGDHGLHDQMTFIKYLFEYFLIELDLPRLRTR
jgi:pimeloyl-ACP methyl ester carboxylesterase